MCANANLNLLQSFGVKGKVLKELLHYCNHSFKKLNGEDLQLEDPIYIKSYKFYSKQAEDIGAFEALKQHLVQLQFPIQEGISQTEAYRNVVLRGKKKEDGPGLQLVAPQHILLQVYEDDLIGEVPVLLIPNRDDFTTIVCALTNKNEPKKIPASMGAAFIKGLNNWSRIHQLRKDWSEKHPFESWQEEFRKNILPHHESYQDQIILLSEQPYSNVKSDMLNLEYEEWKSYSVNIRRAHECAHAFTLRYYGKMENHIFDELVADYVGITSVLGKFELNWFLHFMGLEDPRYYREGGRFQNYLPNLSAESAKVLQCILIEAARNLYLFDSSISNANSSLNRMNLIKSIYETGFLQLASEYGPDFLIEKYKSYEMIST